MRLSWLSPVMVLAGLGLLVSASHGAAAEKSGFRQGGTLRIVLGSDIDDIDPARASGEASWPIERAIGVTLLNYPDAPGPRGSRLALEGASRVTVSRDARTYTFTIRRGLRFSNGAPVRARNFAYAIERALNRKLESPAFQLIGNKHGIEGARDVRGGRARHPRGVWVRGNKLFVRLARSDGTFLSAISTPFFQAVPLSLSRTERVNAVDAAHPLPTAGPYYVESRDPGRLVVLARNPFYRGARVRRPDRVEIRVAASNETAYEDVRANRADYTRDLPRAALTELGREFGLGGRFRVRPAKCISLIVMNASNPLFRNNARLRRAVNYAIDRAALAALAGPYASIPTDQYLPIGSPGFRDIEGYPLRGDLAAARRLAQGQIPAGRPWKYYYGLAAPGPQRMELVRSSLAQIGITIEPQGFRGFAIYDAAGRRNSPHAFTTAGWCQDRRYADPHGLIDLLVSRGLVGANFHDARYDRRLARAAKLVGAGRLRAYERIEHDLVTKAALLAAWGQPANHHFFSDSVDTRSFAYQPIYESPPYNLLALK